LIDRALVWGSEVSCACSAVVRASGSPGQPEPLLNTHAKRRRTLPSSQGTQRVCTFAMPLRVAFTLAAGCSGFRKKGVQPPRGWGRSPRSGEVHGSVQRALSKVALVEQASTKHQWAQRELGLRPLLAERPSKGYTLMGVGQSISSPCVLHRLVILLAACKTRAHTHNRSDSV